MPAEGHPRPAQTLQEISAQTLQEPLKSGDPRYADVSAGRGTRELQKMRLCIEDHRARDNRYAKIAFTGHRGAGKSTELLRLEHDLGDRFTCLHLFVDENLIRDCDYTDLLLWMVDAVVDRFASDRHPLKQQHVESVEWFAEKTLEDTSTVKAEIAAEMELKGQTKADWWVASLRLLARIKSRIQGNIEQRKVIRQTLQNYGRELVDRVNILLDQAQNALEKANKAPDLLIVQDNLDRLPEEVCRRLFFQNGDLLKQLRAHVIFTVPIAMILAPWNIGTVFENRFTMPMIKISNLDNEAYQPGIDALVRLVAARADVDAVFTSNDIVAFLARMSGGSVRDLLRLINYAQLEARTDGKTQIDQASADAAVKELRIDFERLLIPRHVYFPLLREIHQTKADWESPEQKTDATSVKQQREFFSELLLNGSVLEYNGDRSWYDVHPIVQRIDTFNDNAE
ncbi:hypothetical protein [Defluviicoccus vanus]|uniref:ATP-binding protein n=1 Tax=Defluviicoccus vanus TaxID=111831 RepID=A0A7H1N5M8_9PROT|nr:hypothetical protein [Defluviicoccus vanus]QNT71014.1 hypothetical protein HQ394_18995 [Defluviicoccus vanus]